MQVKSFYTIISGAIKQNLLPGLILQLFALSMGLCYYFWPPSHLVFDFFSGLKGKYGILYSFFSTSLFGGLLPFLYLYSSGKIKNNVAKCFLFYIFFWAYKGIEIDLFYTFQSYLFGDATNFITIAKKTAVDQGIYGVLWAAPTMSVAMLWVESDFSFSKLRQRVNRQWMTVKIPTVALTNLMIWLPVVCVVYMMPPALQVPVSNLALCFFVLLLAYITSGKNEVC